MIKTSIGKILANWYLVDRQIISKRTSKTATMEAQKKVGVRQEPKEKAEEMEVESKLSK